MQISALRFHLSGITQMDFVHRFKSVIEVTNYLPLK